MYKNCTCTEYIVDTQACSCFVPDALSTLEKSKITTTISYNKTFIYRVGDCLPHPRGIQETWHPMESMMEWSSCADDVNVMSGHWCQLMGCAVLHNAAEKCEPRRCIPLTFQLDIEKMWMLLYSVRAEYVNPEPELWPVCVCVCLSASVCLSVCVCMSVFHNPAGSKLLSRLWQNVKKNQPFSNKKLFSDFEKLSCWWRHNIFCFVVLSSQFKSSLFLNNQTVSIILFVYV